LEKSPKILGPKNKNIEDFTEFSKAMMRKSNNGEDTEIKTIQLNMSREFNHAARLNDSNMSYDSFRPAGEKRGPFKISSGDHSPNGFRSPKNFRDSLFSNEGE